MLKRALLLGLTIACARGDTGPSGPVELVPDDGRAYVPGVEWRTASPASLSLDAARVESMWRGVMAGRYGSIHGIVIVRFGYVAFERYNAWTRDQPHTMQSVTKSVTSLLYGIQSAGGTTPTSALDRPVLDVFTRYPSIANVDDRKRALTLRHLLTMRTSMDFFEQPYPGSPLDELNRSANDWTKFILDRGMTGRPGTAWAYNSGAAILLCSALREISGENPDAYARRELFAPIGVAGETWFRSPFDALPHCGGGLALKAVDLARIGYLVLRHGAWGDRQVVPRAWIDTSTHALTRGPPVFFSDFGSGYGYFWWLFPSRRGGTDEGIIAASGSGGQWLFVVPSLDLVVAIVAADGNGLDLLYDEILPAVKP